MRKPSHSAVRWVLLLLLAQAFPGFAADSDLKGDLKAKELSKRRAAVSHLVAQNDPASAPLLKEALTDRDPPIRVMALQGLRELGSMDIGSTAASILTGDLDPAVREEAARTLKERNDPAALSALLKGVADGATDVRILCLEALGESPQPRARAALLRAAKDPVPEVRRTVMSQFAHASDPSVIPMLTAALSDSDAGVRARAAQGLSFFGKLHTPHELQNLLNDPDPTVRAAAARALTQAGDPQGLTAALDVLKDPDVRARLIGAEALGYSKDQEARAALAQAVTTDPDPYVREGAKLSLQRIGGRL